MDKRLFYQGEQGKVLKLEKKRNRTYKDILKRLDYEKVGEEETFWTWFGEQEWDDRHKKILKEYFTSSITLRALGKKYELSNERIRQINAKIIKCMLHPKRRQTLFNRLSRTEYWGDKIYNLLSEISEKLDKVGFAKDRWIALGELLNRPIDSIEWSVRTTHAFRCTYDPRFKKIETLKDLVRETEHSLLERKAFGRVSLEEVKTKLDSLGLQLGMDV